MSIQKRLFDCASIAGPYVDAGLGHNQSSAHYALVHSTFRDLTAMADRIPDWQNMPLVAIIPMIIEREADKLNAQAAVLQWAQRRAAYLADRTSWEAAEPKMSSAWREMPMTASQRYLIADTAQLLAVEVPNGMNRGAASDWLEANGSHVINRLGEERS